MRPAWTGPRAAGLEYGWQAEGTVRNGQERHAVQDMSVFALEITLLQYHALRLQDRVEGVLRDCGGGPRQVYKTWCYHHIVWLQCGVLLVCGVMRPNIQRQTCTWPVFASSCCAQV